MNTKNIGVTERYDIKKVGALITNRNIVPHIGCHIYSVLNLKLYTHKICFLITWNPLLMHINSTFLSSQARPPIHLLSSADNI